MKYLNDDIDNERIIDIVKYADEVEEGMKQFCSKVKRMADPDTNGAAWYYEMGEELCGFVSLNSNSNGIQIPTVSITISLGEISNWNRQDFLNILDKNGDLFRAAFTVAEIEGSWILFLQYKVMAASFKPEEFEKCIDYLQLQAAGYVPELRYFSGVREVLCERIVGLKGKVQTGFRDGRMNLL